VSVCQCVTGASDRKYYQRRVQLVMLAEERARRRQSRKPDENIRRPDMVRDFGRTGGEALECQALCRSSQKSLEQHMHVTFEPSCN